MAEIYFKDRNEWRKWLQGNHEKESKVAVLKYKKHTGKPSMSHRESIEEAICFGWIDTTIKKLDENRYIRNFSKRSKNSRWSSNTIKYAKDMIKLGKMSPFGLKMLKEGLARPLLDAGIPKDPRTPTYLKKALEQNPKAKENFNKLAPSMKRAYLRWLLKAQRQETRDKRVNQLVQVLEKDKKLFSNTKDV